MSKKSDTKATSTHKMGARCGYTLLQDGSIDPAPTYKSQFAEISLAQQALDDTMKTMTAHFIEHQKAIRQRFDVFWNALAEDYGPDFSREDDWSFNGRLLKKKPKQEPGKP
jgi:uncharacterized membrane protein YccC